MPNEDPNGVVSGRGDASEAPSFDEHVSQPTNAFSGLRWRAALLVLVASLGAALLSDALETVMNTTILGLRGTHVLVTIPAAR